MDFFRRLCLNASISNFDDHGKNHGFLYRENAWRLSPVFDLESLPGHPCHAINSDKNGCYSSVKNILTAYENFGLDSDREKAELSDVATIVSENWLSLAQGFGADEEWVRFVGASYSRAETLRFDVHQANDLTAR